MPFTELALGSELEAARQMHYSRGANVLDMTAMGGLVLACSPAEVCLPAWHGLPPASSITPLDPWEVQSRPTSSSLGPGQTLAASAGGHLGLCLWVPQQHALGPGAAESAS